MGGAAIVAWAAVRRAGIVVESKGTFRWCDGKQAALSLTFDDARSSQLDRGLAILNKHGIRASFYISPKNVEKRAGDWQRVVSDGHELGNQTYSHPCSGNYAWSRDNALEDYTLARMGAELEAGDEFIAQALGVEARTFAYPCAQPFVGRGRALRSYVPLIAERYVVGRDFFNNTSNAPDFCDLALVACVDSDRTSLEELWARVEQAMEEGSWLVFGSHEVGESKWQSMDAEVLDELCRRLRAIEDKLWLGTVAAVGEYVCSTRTS